MSFESKWEKKRRERREREREVGSGGSSEGYSWEDMAEMSLRVGRLERAMMCDGSGSSSCLGGSEWACWSGAWWNRTRSNMNSANKRKVSRAVKQAMDKEGDRLRADMNRMMKYLRDEMKMENTSNTDREN